MEDTVDALGYTADVKTRGKESLQDTRDSAKESVMGASRSVKESSSVPRTPRPARQAGRPPG